MERLKVTPGEWSVENLTDIFSSTRFDGTESDSNDAWQIADCFVSRTTSVQGEELSLSIQEQRANATLIADAGATYNKCGKLPSELMEERDKWIEAFQKTSLMHNDMCSTASKLKNDYDKAMEQNRELIEALAKIRFFCDTVNFSSHNQMREAIESSLETSEEILTKLEATPLVEPKDK